jgi:hypothetical protein
MINDHSTKKLLAQYIVDAEVFFRVLVETTIFLSHPEEWQVVRVAPARFEFGEIFTSSLFNGPSVV